MKTYEQIAQARAWHRHFLGDIGFQLLVYCRYTNATWQLADGHCTETPQRSATVSSQYSAFVRLITILEEPLYREERRGVAT